MKTVYKKGIQDSDDPFLFTLSTDSQDRQGDIIEQDWDLKDFLMNPIALWMHDHHEPIGTWNPVELSKRGLKARLNLAEPGTSELIDRLRRMVEQRILRATSVGLKPLAAKYIDERNPEKGVRITKAKLLEASLVSVPALQDALNSSDPATLVTRSLSGDDKKFLNDNAALCTGACLLPAAKQMGMTPNSRAANVSISNPKQGNSIMTIAEKIAAREKSIVELRDNLATIAGADDLTDEATLQVEELSGKIEADEKALATLQRAEQALAGRAAASEKALPAAPRIQVAKAYEADKGYLATATVATLLKAHASKVNPLDLVKAAYGDNAEEVGAMVKAATDSADMTTSGWASQLVEQGWNGFLELVRDVAVYPRVPGTRLSFGSAGTLNVPGSGGRGQLAAGFVTEGAPIPVKQGLVTSTSLAPKGLGVISAMTKKIVAHSVPQIQTLVRDTIIGDTAEALDTAFLDANARSATRPAGLQDTTSTGSANINASGGNTAALIIADAKAVLGRVLAGRVGNSGAWVMNPLRVLGLQTVQDAASGEYPFREDINRGMFFGSPVIVSQNVTAAIVAYVADSSMIHAVDFGPQIEVSDQATLVMDNSSPSDIVTVSAGTGIVPAQPVRSMYQTDSLAIKLTLGLDWVVSRQTGVQVLTSVGW